MKKILSFLIIALIIIIAIIFIDLTFIFITNRPLFYIKVRQPYTYVGIFYNVYNCPEYPMAQIKSKNTKFGCAVPRDDIGKVIDIIDTTKDIKDFVCAEALEEFYEDENYKYFYSCIKGKDMIVKYESGFEETIEKALKYGTITISDLDYYDIDYIKHEITN